MLHGIANCVKVWPNTIQLFNRLAIPFKCSFSLVVVGWRNLPCGKASLQQLERSFAPTDYRNWCDWRENHHHQRYPKYPPEKVHVLASPVDVMRDLAPCLCCKNYADYPVIALQNHCLIRQFILVAAVSGEMFPQMPRCRFNAA